MNKRFFSRLAFLLLQAGAAAVFFGTVAHHVYTLDFKPLAALCIPVLAVFFTFTSLLFIRGRSLGRGRPQLRTLFAAEQSMQATVSYLAGIAIGTSLHGLLHYTGFQFDPAQPTLSGLWLLVFLVPYALMQAGFLMFMRAAWIVGPQFVGVSRYEVWRRIAQEP